MDMIDSVKKSKEGRDDCTRGHDWKLFKKRVNLDAGEFSFGNCNEWNKLQPARVGCQCGENK